MNLDRLYWRIICMLAGRHLPEREHGAGRRRWERVRCRRCGERLDP